MNKIKLFEDYIQEMALTDVTVKKILDHLKNSDEEEIKRCKDIISGDENSIIREILKRLQECDYKDIKEIEKEIFG